MEPVHLAITESSFGGVDPWMLLSLLLNPVVLIGAFILVSARARKRAVREFGGPPLPGTAQALSVRREPGLAGLLGRSYVLTRIGLRVELPDRQPYDATVTTALDSRSLAALCVDGQRWEPGRPWHVRPGTTFEVEVDSTDPLNVRIVSDPIPPPAGSAVTGSQPPRKSFFDYSDMSLGYRMLMYLWWAVSVGGSCFVAYQLFLRR
jgi:hypothetical protein